MAAEEDTAVSELVELNAGRAAMYRTLAQYYFKELAQEEVEFVAAQDFSGLSGSDDLIAEGFEDMRRYLRKMDSGTRQSLAVDYAHTFLAAGNYESFAATPFESVFTSETGLLMQEARDEVYKMYCEQHIQPNEELHTPEDHLSFEFEFMATVLERQSEALSEGDIAQARSFEETLERFHDEHQLNWIDDLCDAIEDVAKTRFYRGVSKVTRGFVHLETEVLADVSQVLEELAGDADQRSAEA